MDEKRPTAVDPRNLPQDRLATTDKDGRRVYVYPADVSGRFKQRRTLVHAALILVFLILPWIKIGGQQAILLDIARRRFAIFGVTFWAHDAPMLVFVVGGAVLSIAFATAMWGRAWCGWACPQTVFIENVFRRIERWIEGDALARKALDAQPWNGDRFWKKAVKWTLFAAVTLVVSHSFLAYFVGAENLKRLIASPPSENAGAFLFMAGVTGLLLFDFGWFREQFCTVVCPYGRFQSLLMDNNSLVIAYDEKRGDCVNCFRCVQVCPTGIDIRRGVQLECIACTACVDACDTVMDRLHKPRGLIRYDTAEKMAGRVTRWLRPRTIIMFALLLAVAIGLVATVHSRSDATLVLSRPAGSLPYQELGVVGGRALVANRFRVELSNQSFEPLAIKLEARGDARVSLAGAMLELTLEPGGRASTEIFVQFDRTLLQAGKAQARVAIVSLKDGKVLDEEGVPLAGPYQ